MGLDIFFSRKKESQVGYFRKVNFLVAYFADLGFDVENQTPLSITKEDAQVLLERCKQVLTDHSKAEELLPTMSGFFFGSTEYDEYYFDDVKKVANFIENELIPAFNDLKDDEFITFETWY